MTRPDPLFEEHERSLATVIGPPYSAQRFEAILRSKVAEGVRRGLIDPDWRAALNTVQFVERISWPTKPSPRSSTV